MVSMVSFETIAPRLSTSPVKPLLDCPSSNPLSFPKQDSSTSVVPGRHAPIRTLDDSTVTNLINSAPTPWRCLPTPPAKPPPYPLPLPRTGTGTERSSRRLQSLHALATIPPRLPKLDQPAQLGPHSLQRHVERRRLQPAWIVHQRERLRPHFTNSWRFMKRAFDR